MVFSPNYTFAIMAQFIPFQESVEVTGQAILAVVNALKAGQTIRLRILTKHGLGDLQPKEWYNQRALLNAMREISTTFGIHTLFAIGEIIPEFILFPAEGNNLKKALEFIDTAYHLNHRGGEIGHYSLEQFDENKHAAVMVCYNPYPSEFDRGLITSIVKKFAPATSPIYDVQLDRSKESRLTGADSCTYVITW